VYLPILILLALSSISLVATSNAEPSLPCVDCIRIPSYEIDHYKAMFPITVWTDSPVYDHHSTIKVNGYLKPQNTVAPIIAVVTNPIGNVVTIEQFISEGDGNFSFELNTESPLWTQNGEYVLKVQSGADTRQFKTKFTLVSSLNGTVDKCTSDKISLANNGRVYCIPFTITNGVLTSVKGTLNSNTNTMTLDMKGHDITSVTLDIPRYIFDAKSQSDTDSVFTIMSNGNIIQYQEMGSDSISRHIQFDYPNTGKATFEIIGTHVIPEFGSIALLILIGSIMSILVISRSVSNRFVKF